MLDFPAARMSEQAPHCTIMTNSVKVCIQLLLWPQWLEFHLCHEEIAKQAVHFYADENAENRRQ